METITRALVRATPSRARRATFSNVFLVCRGTSSNQSTGLTLAINRWVLLRQFARQFRIPPSSHNESCNSGAALEEFHTWLERQAACALPKSAFGQAVQYCLNQWSKLTAFLQDGRLELDNNRSERSIKAFVVGRKNWLFANTPRGARSSAIIYSIVETAKENGLNPFAYLTYLLDRLPNVDIGNPAALDDLLPWSADLPATCRVPASPTA